MSWPQQGHGDWNNTPPPPAYSIGPITNEDLAELHEAIADALFAQDVPVAVVDWHYRAADYFREERGRLHWSGRW